jgi:predicted amidophosphoribosyltransferase
MAHKIRVPKTKSYTKYACSECQKPVEFQAGTCPFCKADVSKTPNRTLYLNLAFIAIFVLLAFLTMK